MCFTEGEFRVGTDEVWLGQIYGCGFFTSASQFGYWKHTQLTVEVVKGRGPVSHWKSRWVCGFLFARGFSRQPRSRIWLRCWMAKRRWPIADLQLTHQYAHFYGAAVVVGTGDFDLAGRRPKKYVGGGGGSF
jgi:hypothetical protein